MTRVFFRCLFDSRARKLWHCCHDSRFCAKVRRVRAFSNWDNEMVRFRGEADIDPISKVGCIGRNDSTRKRLRPRHASAYKEVDQTRSERGCRHLLYDVRGHVARSANRSKSVRTSPRRLRQDARGGEARRDHAAGANAGSKCGFRARIVANLSNDRCRKVCAGICPAGTRAIGKHPCHVIRSL